MNSLDLKPVSKYSIQVDPHQVNIRGGYGHVKRGLLEGRAETMAIKEFRASGADEDRLRAQIVS